MHSVAGGREIGGCQSAAPGVRSYFPWRPSDKQVEIEPLL